VKPALLRGITNTIRAAGTDSATVIYREPPFAITHISPEPIVHPTMVNETLGWAYKVVDYIVFPMGFTVDDRYIVLFALLCAEYAQTNYSRARVPSCISHDRFIHLSYGKNDKSPWCLKLDREGLIASLKPVRTNVLGSSVYNEVTGEIQRHSYSAVPQ
jgi:hypothetical protein